MNEEKDYEFKKLYTTIFSLNYFAQGINQSIYIIVIPIYLIATFGSINTAAIAFMVSIILIPSTMKLIYGILSDKYSTKRFGRRKPWIILPAIMTGIIWFILPFMLGYSSSIMITIFTIAGIIISFGIFIADTAMDGFLIEISPKSQLGRNQGTCWSLRSVGTIIGGPIALLILMFLPIQAIFVALGVITIGFSFLTLLIKDLEISKRINIILNLKTIFRRIENWKVFTFSFFMAFIAGVVTVFLSLFILLQAGFIKSSSVSLNLLKEDISLYEPQAFITLIIGLGVISGALLGGFLADIKSRRLSIYISLLLTISSLFLLLLIVPLLILLFFAFLIGFASGWSYSSYSSVLSEYSKHYPETNGTYFSICMSFVNFGTIIGLSITGMLFISLSGVTTDLRVVFGTVFIFMAIITSLGIIPFLLMDRNIYDSKITTKRIY